MKAFRYLTLLVLLLAGWSILPPRAAARSADPTLTAPAPVPTELAQLPAAIAMPAASTPEPLTQEQAAVLPLVAPCNFADQSIFYSPSRAWVMVTCLGDKPEDGTITRLTRMDGSQQWSLSFVETFAKPYQREGLDPQTAYLPVRWTKNEDYVYLGVQTSSEETPYKGYDGLFLMNLSTGKIRPTLAPAVAHPNSTYAFKFSPSGIKLAYIKQWVQPLTIGLYDIQTGDEKKITLHAKFERGGSLLWSLDGKQLYGSVSETGQVDGNSVIVCDVETLECKLFTRQPDSVYLPVDWLDDGTLYAQYYPNGWVYIDLTTKDVRPAPAPILATAAQLLARKLAPQPTNASASSLPAEFTDNWGVSMRLVPAGEFVMGESADDARAESMKFGSECQCQSFTDEQPPHVVYLDSYYMDVHEVTNALYKACVAAGVCSAPQDADMLSGGTYYGNHSYDNYPVVDVTWEQAKNYCEWRDMRLPTEAEWEKAARGTDGRTYPWGAKINSSFANYGWHYGTTTPVGKYESGKSPYGMYDMAGNVSEWAADWYDSAYYQNSPARNPLGPDSGLGKVLRGGNFSCEGCGLRVTDRKAASTDDYEDYIGFRCAGNPTKK